MTTIAILKDSEIITEVASRLANKELDSATPINVFESRYIQLNDDEYPAINILLQDKTYIPSNDTAYEVASREVIFQLIVTGDDTTETTEDTANSKSLDLARTKIEILESIVREEFNKKNECLGGFDRRVKSFRINFSSIAIEVTANRVYGICILSYTLQTVDSLYDRNK